MAKSLVIVESPAKAKTINLYLGPDYLVKASMGHVRDLPKGNLGVDVADDFKPRYIIIPGRRKVVNELKKLAQEVESVILAADPDREGEAICWHLKQILENGHPKIFRALLHEITKDAVTAAFRHLVDLDQNKINAQQTRRILDRLVGYSISPLLWEKIGRGLSAGRVQSIALRLICEREKEIKSFIPEEYWTIAALLQTAEPPAFKAGLTKIDGKKAKIKDEKEAAEVVEDLKAAHFILEKITIKEKKKYPPPPYITSTLQQDGFRLLHFPVKKTMFIAQKLYEGLEIGKQGPLGLITYMRTDSFRISDEAIAHAREFLGRNFAPEYIPDKPHHYKNKKKTQDAHEAIRPTSFDLPPEAVRPYLKKEEFSLYTLVWNRFMASQMSPAQVEETEFTIRAAKYELSAKGEVLRFRGFLALYPNQKEETVLLPKAVQGEVLRLLGLEPKQNFTQPPSRYTEGTLVKELEAKGIGRPSTYAPIIATLQDRVYVIKEKGKFIPTDLGIYVTDFLIKHFADLMDIQFTARMEDELDSISEGEQEWQASLRRFYGLLEQDLKKGKETEGVKQTGIPVADKCPRCGRGLVIKSGKFGRFKACSGYPECDYKESLVKKEVKELDEKCPQCGAGLVVRTGRFGSFVACSAYPQCNYVKKEQAGTGIACPNKCGGMIIRKKTRKGKVFYSCDKYPECRFAVWDEPRAQSCPRCGADFVLRKNGGRGKSYLYCRNEACDYKEPEKEETFGPSEEKPPDEKRG